MKRWHDPEIEVLLSQEEARQLSTLNLIASENFTSPQVRAALGSVLSHKYAEGLPFKRYYGGCEVIDQIEALAIERAKKIFGATWVNVQPHAGSQANAAVMFASLKAGDRILGFNLNHGGHLTHGATVNFSGVLYRSSSYGVNPQTGRVDMAEVERIAMQEKPRLIICGGSSYSRDWEYDRFREIADAIGAILLGDIAHPAGLIARGLLKDPMKHCHIITTTTHKTLRGARGGMIMLGENFDNPLGLRDRKGKIKPMSVVLDSAVFPGLQGGPHENNIAGKAVAFAEVASEDYHAYVTHVIENAQKLAHLFIEKGYDLISGGTDNHLFLIDLSNKGLTGKEAEKVLGKAGIIVNKNVIPFDTQSPFVTSGIRIGTPAITTRGLRKEEMTQIAEWIDTVLRNPTDENLIARIRQDVQEKMIKNPLFA
ncbi:MAG: serine hydroxymethyltransferase [Bacteroidota bacterium]